MQEVFRSRNVVVESVLRQKASVDRLFRKQFRANAEGFLCLTENLGKLLSNDIYVTVVDELWIHEQPRSRLRERQLVLCDCLEENQEVVFPATMFIVLNERGLVAIRRQKSSNKRRVEAKAPAF